MKGISKGGKGIANPDLTKHVKMPESNVMNFEACNYRRPHLPEDLEKVKMWSKGY